MFTLKYVPCVILIQLAVVGIQLNGLFLHQLNLDNRAVYPHTCNFQWVSCLYYTLYGLYIHSDCTSKLLPWFPKQVLMGAQVNFHSTGQLPCVLSGYRAENRSEWGQLFSNIVRCFYALLCILHCLIYNIHIAHLSGRRKRSSIWHKQEWRFCAINSSMVQRK